MQAQATGSRRYGINRMVMLALAIGALAIAARLAISNIELGADKPADTLVAHPAALQGEGQVDRANSVAAAGSGRLPIIRYTAPYAGEGLREMRFLQWNTLPAGILPVPAQGIERTHFLEQNIWEYAGDDMAQPAGDYLYPAIRDLAPSAPAPAGILSAPAQSIEQMHFLEQNVWEYGGGSAVVSGLDDYLYLEEYVAGKEMEDARSTVPGIHRDEGFNSAPDE